MAADLIVAPHNLKIEQALLGAILVNNDAYDRVADFLAPSHFFLTPHARIFEVMGNLIRNGRTCTPAILKTYLPADLRIDGIRTVDQYISFLLGEATHILNAQPYGRVIYHLAIRRELIVITEDARSKAAKDDLDVEPTQQLEDLERRLFILAEAGNANASGFVNFAEAATEAIDMAARAYQRDGGLSGLPTGLIDLDTRLGGLQDSDLIILAGRPGMGKTALATNIAYNIAKRIQDTREAGDTRGGVGFFSLEMSEEQLATRIIAERAGIASSRIRRGAVTEAEMNLIAERGRELLDLPLYIDATGGLSLAQVVTRARRLKRRRGISLLVVDYLQLMRGSSRRQNESRVLEVSEITAGLKTLAKELAIPVLALSQLSRRVEERDDKRPQLADLRESGSIEQDADVVMFLYREEYYVQMRRPPETSPRYPDWCADAEQAEGKAEAIIAKHRHGPTDTVPLQFTAELTKFSNLAR